MILLVLPNGKSGARYQLMPEAPRREHYSKEFDARRFIAQVTMKEGWAGTLDEAVEAFRANKGDELIKAFYAKFYP